MSWLLRFYRSTIGLKVTMAVTGIILYGFVIVHMVGNAQIYLGETTLNDYAQTLRAVPELLWLVRVILLASLGLHIEAWLTLRGRSRAARPQGYKVKRNVGSTVMSRTMKVTGPLILAFVIFHLLHLTWGVISPGFRFQECTGPYGEVTCHTFENVVHSFRIWWITAVYVIGQLILAPHLAHGGWSLFRTLGLHDERWDAVVKNAVYVVTWVTVVVNISIPLAVFTRIVGANIQ